MATNLSGVGYVANIKPREGLIFRWTVADIDAAIPAIRGKRDAALAKGDLAAAEQHQGWLDRLLDARPHHAEAEALG